MGLRAASATDVRKFNSKWSNSMEKFALLQE